MANIWEKEILPYMGMGQILKGHNLVIFCQISCRLSYLFMPMHILTCCSGLHFPPHMGNLSGFSSWTKFVKIEHNLVAFK